MSDPLNDARAKAVEASETLSRLTADFESFKGRVARELEDARRRGREDLLLLVLPVFDNLERAIESAKRESSVKATAEGLQMIRRQLDEVLARVRSEQ